MPPCHEHEIAFELHRRWENRPRTLEGSGRRAAADPPASSRRNDRGTPTGRRGRFKPIQGESRQLKVKKFCEKDQSSETPNPMNALACHGLRLPSSNAGQTQPNRGQSEPTHSQLLMLRWNGSHQIALNRTTLPGHRRGGAAGENPAGRDPNTANYYQPQHVDRESGRVVRARHGRPRCHPNTIPSAPKRVKTRQAVDLGWQGASKGGLAVEKKRLRNRLRRGFVGLLPLFTEVVAAALRPWHLAARTHNLFRNLYVQRTQAGQTRSKWVKPPGRVFAESLCEDRRRGLWLIFGGERQNSGTL